MPRLQYTLDRRVSLQQTSDSDLALYASNFTAVAPYACTIPVRRRAFRGS
jgi:hypothetical protein